MKLSCQSLYSHHHLIDNSHLDINGLMPTDMFRKSTRDQGEEHKLAHRKLAASPRVSSVWTACCTPVGSSGYMVVSGTPLFVMSDRGDAPRRKTGSLSTGIAHVQPQWPAIWQRAFPQTLTSPVSIRRHSACSPSRPSLTATAAGG